MDGDVEEGNAFAIPRLWETLTFARSEQNLETTPALSLEPLDIPKNNHIYPEIPKDNDLPFLNSLSLAHNPIEDIGSLETSSVSSLVESFDIPESVPEDVWCFPVPSENQETRLAKLKTWEVFCDASFQEPRSVYISEAGPEAFDAALAAPAADIGGPRSQTSGRVIHSEVLIASLLQLGLGRESVLYFYSSSNHSFCPYIVDGRLSGYSLGAFQVLANTFIDLGNRTRSLQDFVHAAQSSDRPFPALIALAHSISTLLATLQLQIGKNFTLIRSLLQMQSHFEQPSLLLSHLQEIISRIEGTTTDEELLTKLFAIVQESEVTTVWLRPLIFQIFANVSKPWLASLDRWLGLKSDVMLGKEHNLPAFVRTIEDELKLEGRKEVKVLDCEFESRGVPSFMAEEDALAIFLIGRSLRLLEIYQPHNPLVRSMSLGNVHLPILEWHFTWRDIERLRTRAAEYESVLQQAMYDFNVGDSSFSVLDEDDNVRSQKPVEEAMASLPEESAKAYISASIASFEKPICQLRVTNDPTLSGVLLETTCKTDDFVQNSVFGPPISLLSVISLGPLISAQARMINQACLRLLVKQHGLLSHISLIHRYSLFGDGVFASRLSHALFDPTLQSAERRKGHSRSGISGLKLEYRNNWPPASSELRLVLMGILTDSYYHGQQRSTSASMFRAELPGGLSFAIRDMSDEDLQKCMDPNSIEALDFLKLHYKPPPPLDVIISQTSLSKCDIIFKLLLRIIRMQFVVNQLFQDNKIQKPGQKSEDSVSRSFQIESHHFVSVICSFMFDGVQEHWRLLDRKLKSIEKSLDQQDPSESDGLDNLREFYEQVLDRMIFALLLRKRQVQVMELLEEIFGLILLFAKHLRAKTLPDGDIYGDSEGRSHENLNDIHNKFRKKVKVFVRVCRGLTELQGQGGIKGGIHCHHDFFRNENLSDKEGNRMGQLLLRFEMNDFYTH